MEKSSILILLTLFTLLSGMAVAAYEVWGTKRAKKTGEHFDGSKVKPHA